MRPDELLKKILGACCYAVIKPDGTLVVDVHVDDLTDEERDYIVALCEWTWRSGNWRTG